MASVTTFGPWDPDSRVVLICGGGPAGLLAACLLSKRGYKVHVFEKREDPSKSRPGRSWVIVFQERAQNALRLADLDVATAGVGLKMKGAMLHSVRGKRELLYNPDVPPYSVDRTDLMGALLEKVRNDGRSSLHFDSSYGELQGGGSTVTFSGGPGAHQGPWSLLIAADGEHSNVRDDLQRKFNFVCSQKSSDKEYIQIMGPRDVLTKAGLDRDYVNIFNKNGDAQLIFTTRVGDVDGGVMVLNADGDVSFKSVRAKDPTELKSFLQEYFTKEGESILEAAYDGKFIDYLKVADVFAGNAATHCSEFHAVDGRVLVIGDAAHSMSASIGQGCNTAFEDVSVLDSLLLEGFCLANVASEFTKRRQADVAAIVDMSANAFPETKLAFAAWVFQSLLVQGLYKRMPSCFPQPMRLLISTDVPYHVVRQRKVFEGRFFKACCLTALMCPIVYFGTQMVPSTLARCSATAAIPCAAFLYAASALRGAWPDKKRPSEKPSKSDCVASCDNKQDMSQPLLGG